MLNIKDLYHSRENHKWYDYPVANAKHEIYKINSPKPFRVYHRDGSFSLAYSFGEYQYTFSINEREEVRKAFYAETKEKHERMEMLKQLANLDLETLKKLTKTT